MTTNKEKNFISAVVYLHNDGARAVKFFKLLQQQLDAHFDQYELIAVDDACTDDTVSQLRSWAAGLDKPRQSKTGPWTLPPPTAEKSV